MNTLGITHSVCPQCRAVVPAKVVGDGEQVRFRKFCREHGESEALVYRGEREYLAAQRFLRAASLPDRFAGSSDAPCPDGCGFCARHEQHLCMPIVEITQRCDLVCPVCINGSGGPAAACAPDLAVAEFERLVDGLLAAERQLDVVTISGGEPLLHPQLLALVDAALARPGVVKLAVATNGLQLLRRPDLLEALVARGVVITLQFDGFDDAAYETLRGRPLRREKLAVLDRLAAADATTSLVTTAARGVNDRQFRAILDFFFAQPHVCSWMIQPIAFTGRAAAFDRDDMRLTMPDVVRLLGEAGHPAVRAQDFLPLPCSHPLCFQLAYYLLLDDGALVSLGSLADAPTLLDHLANRVVFGLDPAEHERMKALVYELWSGPAASVPHAPGVLATLRGILRELQQRAGCCDFDARGTFRLLERRIKSIFVHAFQDADVFDLARVRRCCQGYPQADGRLLPPCVRNVRGA
ncbi:MAG: radical SAM protein, partial [Planctomycetes bacterium]|nr:radical SAM protein [Planctomycetota bacterium]